MKRLILAATLAAAHVFTPAFAGETPAPEGAAVYFIEPVDGAVISGPVTVKFGLSGMGVAPAGTEREKTGHHHVFIDRAPFDPAGDADDPIPSDDNHKHFGGGQTETTLDLAPGTHTLQMVLGDAFHVPHASPVISGQITITVK
ncbi:MAG: DUF4399 domain-containing protein [Litoreibacter sp.]|nr:DUF4399 domain-containing protein [Litoreibacter sp.]